MKRDLKKELTVDDFLSNKVGVNSLRALIQAEMPLPISRIAREIGSNFVTVRRHMRFLQEHELVYTHPYGRRTLYGANLKTPESPPSLSSWTPGNKG